jgi:hypothetical protein
MERFALKTNMYLACGDGPFLRQRVAEALAVSDTRRPAAGIWELRTSPNERKLSFGWMLRSSAKIDRVARDRWFESGFLHR